jgi:hypothetical protein
MKCLVPLAGPDLLHPRHGFRPLVAHGSQTLIEAALNSRAWRTRLASEDFVFVLRQVEGVEALQAFLKSRWPGSAVVTLSTLTRGAMMSALAGAALVGPNEPLIIDLADMLFTSDLTLAFDPTGPVGAIAPCFTASDPCYSYLRSLEGRVVEIAEKRVISSDASVGVYGFRDTAVFLRAAAYALDHAPTLTHAGLFFVAPMLNGVLDQGLEVLAPPVHDVEPIGKMFHDSLT